MSYLMQVCSGVHDNWLVFRKKDPYLIITQKLTFLISWNPADFVRISGEIHQISYGFYVWNPPDFTGEIRRISKD